MEKLELKHLAPYLPYGLTGICTEEFTGIETVYGISYYKGSSDVYLITSFDDLDIEYFKPILRPLSDLTKKEYKNSFYGNPLDYKIDELPYKVFIKLLELHFDVFGLIEKGLAIDINTLNK